MKTRIVRTFTVATGEYAYTVMRFGQWVSAGKARAQDPIGLFPNPSNKWWPVETYTNEYTAMQVAQRVSAMALEDLERNPITVVHQYEDGKVSGSTQED